MFMVNTFGFRIFEPPIKAGDVLLPKTVGALPLPASPKDVYAPVRVCANKPA